MGTSRIARNPVAIPAGATVTLNDQRLVVKGSKGTLERDVHHAVVVEFESEAKTLKFSARDNSASANALAGTECALAKNYLAGVTVGFERKLELVGVGYRAQAQGNVLTLSLGYSHPIVFNIPAGITIKTPTQTEIIIEGADKHRVGQVAADIQQYRPPECYKGKGVRRAGQVIKLKETKKK